MTRAFQQFSRFRLGKELIQITQHHFLKQHQVGQCAQIFKSLAFKLGEPRERLGQSEKAIWNIELVFRLLSGAGDVKRPRGRDARLAGLDEFGNGDVNDTLTAGLGATNSQQAINLPGCALTCGAREFVAKKCIDWITIVTAIGRLGHFCLALHVLAWSVQTGL